MAAAIEAARRVLVVGGFPTERVVDIHLNAAEDELYVTLSANDHASQPKVPPSKRRRPREYQRIAVRCGCWLEHDHATVYGNTVDLGRGGLFLRTALPMDPGAKVRVTLQLPSHETVVAEGKVVRIVSPDRGDRPGLGVRFDHLPDGEDSLHAFLFGRLESGSRDVEGDL